MAGGARSAAGGAAARAKSPMPAHGADQPARRRVLQLAAQIVHIDIHNVRGLRRLQIPHRIEQLDPRDTLAAVLKQMLEKREFLVGENDQATPAPRRVIQPVQFQIAGPQLQPRLALAAQQSTAPRAQLMQAERLGHQVVRSAIEAAHPRVDLLPSGQHQHRQIGIERANFFEHLLAILHRHIQVQNGQIRHLGAKRLNGGSAVVGHADTVTVGLKSPAQKQPQSSVIFGNK